MLIEDIIAPLRDYQVYFKSRYDPVFEQNEFPIDEAYCKILEVLLLVFIFGIFIPEIYVFGFLVMIFKYCYYKRYCKQQIKNHNFLRKNFPKKIISLTFLVMKSTWKTLVFNEKTHSKAVSTWSYLWIFYLSTGLILFHNNNLLLNWHELSTSNKDDIMNNFSSWYDFLKISIEFLLEFYRWNSGIFLAGCIVLWFVL